MRAIGAQDACYWCARCVLLARTIHGIGAQDIQIDGRFSSDKVINLFGADEIIWEMPASFKNLYKILSFIPLKISYH